MVIHDPTVLGCYGLWKWQGYAPDIPRNMMEPLNWIKRSWKYVFGFYNFDVFFAIFVWLFGVICASLEAMFSSVEEVFRLANTPVLLLEL